MNQRSADVIVVGAGHNGLVAAILLARAGLKVVLLEAHSFFGGATRTERPFRKAPGLGASTASYLCGLVPPELLRLLDARIELIRRDPHYFLPSTSDRYLLFGSDRAAMREQFERYYTRQDWEANEALCEEIGKLREDIAPSWLEEPLSAEETAERYVRAELRQVFLDLVHGPAERYLQRFGFRSEVFPVMYSVTDAFSGLDGSFGTVGTGMNFLVHNMCRLPGSDGTFMIARGGMGAVASELGRLAVEAGAEIRTNVKVERIVVENGAAAGVATLEGDELRAPVVLCNCDPFRMRTLAGAASFPPAFNEKLDGLVRHGTTLKVNLALDRLPRFTCLPEDRGQHRGTIHLLPEGEGLMERIRRGYEQVARGRLDDRPTIEMYTHTPVDPSLQDAAGNHNAALFVQWAPYRLAESSWSREEDRYVQRLFEIVEEFAPGFTASVLDVYTLTPPKIEQQIGISYGHIHHVDNTFGFDRRAPYATPLAGLYSCSAGCHPAGSVIGAAGHNAAKRVLRDLGRHR